MFTLVTKSRFFNTTTPAPILPRSSVKTAPVTVVTAERSVKAWTNDNVVVVSPAPVVHTPRTAPRAAQASAVTAPAVNHPVLQKTDLRAETTFYLPQWEGRKDRMFHQTYTTVTYRNTWVISEGVGIPDLVLTDELRTIPYHHPIPGATVKAIDAGKVVLVTEPDKSGLKSNIAWLADRHGRYSDKHHGYVMTFKKFADFMYCKTNGAAKQIVGGMAK